MWKFIDNLYGRSSRWRSVRNQHLKEFPECAACGRKDNLEVHHIIPYNVDPDKELDRSNLITLCGKYCHFVFGHFMNWKSWNENVEIDCKEYNLKKQNRNIMQETRPNKKIFSFLKRLIQ